MKSYGLVVFAMLAIALLCSSAMAQGDNSVYFVTYYSNNVTAAPDATVRVVNDGATESTLYADFFVFDDSEELTQCCSCPVTPDGLLSESVRKELTAFPLRNIVNTRGVIKMISSSTFFGAPSFTAETPTPGLRAWATHIQSVANKTPNGPAPYTQTESPFADANLAASEQSLIESLCQMDHMLSGQPCACTPEDSDF